jgi:hypothetical protein
VIGRLATVLSSRVGDIFVIYACGRNRGYKQTGGRRDFVEAPESMEQIAAIKEAAVAAADQYRARGPQA